MSPPLYLFSICLPFATVLLVFAMRYFALARQASAELAAGTANASALAAIHAALAELGERLGAIEKILREVA